MNTTPVRIAALALAATVFVAGCKKSDTADATPPAAGA